MTPGGDLEPNDDDVTSTFQKAEKISEIPQVKGQRQTHMRAMIVNHKARDVVFKAFDINGTQVLQDTFVLETNAFSIERDLFE